MKLRHLAAVCAALVVGAVAIGPTRVALAHAELESTNPSAGSLLDSSPPQIVLTFSEQVDRVDESIRLIGSDGVPVELGDVGQGQGPNTITAEVPTLSDGTYVVSWKAVSADSHPVSGAFTFSVGAVSPANGGLLDTVVDGQQPSRGAEIVLDVGKVLSWLGLVLLVGVTAFVVAWVPAQFATRRTRALLAIGGASGVVGVAMMIVGQAWLTQDRAWSPSAWGDVVTSTSGRWWGVRAVCLLALAAVVAVGRRSATDATWRVFVSVMALASVAATAGGGHGVSGRVVALGFPATAGHLLAMCVWIGGLVVIALVVPRPDRWAFAVRFSPVALVAAGVLVATGVANAWRQGVSADDVTASSYGRWLLPKMVLVALVFAAAAVNRWLLRTAGANRALEHSDTSTSAAATGVHRVVCLELVGAALVLIATTGLTSSSPPHAAMASSGGSPAVTVVEGERSAMIRLDPAVVGGTRLNVVITNASNAAENPDEVVVRATPVDGQLGALTIPVTLVSTGEYGTDAAVLPLPGRWRIDVSARYGRFEQVVFSAQFDVR